MANITAFGSITETGILSLANRKRLQNDLLQFKGCTVELTIKKRNTRSTQSNRYLWGVVYKELEIRLKELGNDVNSEVVHDYCKGRFLATPLIGEGGEKIGDKPGKTSELNSYEFTDYIEKIAQWASEYLGLCIPAPNSDLTFNF